LLSLWVFAVAVLRGRAVAGALFSLAVSEALFSLAVLCAVFTCCVVRCFHLLCCALFSLAVPPQKLKLTDWMLVMCKLSEIQMSSKLDAVADEVEPLKEQLQKLADENKQQQETIDQQKTVISGINALLKESSNV
jgi:hypothetical protein